MTPSATHLIVEHLIAGVVALYALLRLFPEPQSQLWVAGNLPQPVAVLVFLSFAYILGVIVAHLSARLMEPTESGIYLRVLRDASSYSGPQLKAALDQRGYRFQVSDTSEECTPKDAERIFGIMRYAVLAGGQQKDRISYYQTMIRVCRNAALPLLLNAVAVVYHTFSEQKDSTLWGITLSAALLAMGGASYLTARGYTQWLGYATLRGFLEMNPESPSPVGTAASAKEGPRPKRRRGCSAARSSR